MPTARWIWKARVFVFATAYCVAILSKWNCRERRAHDRGQFWIRAKCRRGGVWLLKSTVSRNGVFAIVFAVLSLTNMRMEFRCSWQPAAIRPFSVKCAKRRYLKCTQLFVATRSANISEAEIRPPFYLVSFGSHATIRNASRVFRILEAKFGLGNVSPSTVLTENDKAICSKIWNFVYFDCKKSDFTQGMFS